MGIKRYSDHQADKSKNITDEELKKVEWLKYKIVVPSEKDKKELKEAFGAIHDSYIDTDIVGVNQLAHEYQEHDNIIVDEELYNKLE